MNSLFAVLGIMVCLSALSYCLSSFILRWESSNSNSFICSLFSILNSILLFCSAPVSILIHLYMKRTEKICAIENSQKLADAYSLMDKKTAVLEKELKHFRELASTERKDGYAVGQKQGYRAGYFDGHQDGVAFTLSTLPCPDEKRADFCSAAIKDCMNRLNDEVVYG